MSLTPPESVASANDATDTVRELSTQDSRRVLEQALTMLTPEEREAIETAYFGEYTYAEAAERLGQPLGTVKARIRSGLAKLRQYLPTERDDL